MVFHSVEFFIFLFAVFGIYVCLGHKLQNRMLLCASYLFYSFWDWRFLSLIIISSITDFYCARKISEQTEKKKRQQFVWISCLINLGILGYFKYFNFFAESFIDLLGVVGLNLDVTLARIILPVGISFYTFQSISYTIDVYRKQLQPAESFWDYALYVSFFPQLVAGPIERGKNLLPQIIKPRQITPDNLGEGLLLIYMGLFKKLVLAENLALIVNPIYEANGHGSGGMVLVASYAFLFQVYCDFSAYTDFARGAAKLLGVELMANFRAPYLAQNIQEFWNRWHISLTTWIRDYLFYPLAFKRFWGKGIDVKAITFFTFLIMGLWHGASWNFVLWGGFHGLVLGGYAFYKTWAKKKNLSWGAPEWIKIAIGVFLTFHVCFIGDIFFRATSFEQSFLFLKLLIFDMELSPAVILLLRDVAIFSLPILVLDWIDLKHESFFEFLKNRKIVGHSMIYAMFYLIIFYHQQSTEYIYFQF